MARPITGSLPTLARVTFVLVMRLTFHPFVRLSYVRVIVREFMGQTDRVLLYLQDVERKECDPWFRDDIRIAWITTLYASRDNPQPHVDATYRVLGVHPSEVWPRIIQRRAAMLGTHYRQLFPENSCQKKPAANVRAMERGKRA